MSGTIINKSFIDEDDSKAIVFLLWCIEYVELYGSRNHDDFVGEKEKKRREKSRNRGVGLNIKQKCFGWDNIHRKDRRIMVINWCDLVANSIQPLPIIFSEFLHAIFFISFTGFIIFTICLIFFYYSICKYTIFMLVICVKIFFLLAKFVHIRIRKMLTIVLVAFV